jgi:uncharacterized membrane protein YhhN
MAPAFYSIPLLAVTIPFLVRAGILEKWRQVYVLKPLSTLVVIAAAALSFLQPEKSMTYTIGVLVGLTFSLVGDVALMFEKKRKLFLMGLGSFLLAHVAYAVAFGILGRASWWDAVSAAVLLLVGVGIYRLLRPKLDGMQGPVLVYIVAISVMVSRAVSTVSSPTFGTGQAVMIAVGAVSFYVSDAILALCRFWRPWRYRRISLAFYYIGQLLIALAASLFGPAA